VEHFSDRAEYASLQKLMAATVVGEPEVQRIEFLDALAKMEQQAITQRRDALVSKNREGALSDAEKAELRELLAARVPAPAASS
jgi:DNA primase